VLGIREIEKIEMSLLFEMTKPRNDALRMYNHEKDKQGQKCKIAENDNFTPLSSHFWGEIKNTWVPPFKFLSSNQAREIGHFSSTSLSPTSLSLISPKPSMP
jgi:hypothetical protein